MRLSPLFRSQPCFYQLLAVFLFKADGCRRLLCTTTAEDKLLPLLSVCSDPKQLHQAHGFMVRRGLHHDNLLLSSFIESCSVLGLWDYAYSAFTHTTTTNHQTTDIYLYNTIIKALSRQPHSAKLAIILFNNIHRVPGLRPDTYSFPFALRAVIRLSAIHVGTQIHCQTLAAGLDCDLHVFTALIQMYASCRCVPDARKLFDGMLFRDVTSWNAIVAGYAKIGDIDSALELFEQMPERNVVSWTCVIAGYSQADRPRDAIFIFRRMQVEGAGVEPDGVALLAVLSACASLGTLELGQWIHNYINKRGLHKTVPLNNALIDMYAKSGNIRKAIQVFENMKHKSVITWTTIISGLALHGLGREALEMFSRMERESMKPNDITFIAVLSACSHVGLVEMGRSYFNIMYSRYGLKPKIEHYGCMIDLLGRSGCLQEAQDLVSEMPFEANRAIWGSLLSASRIHGDVELAERAMQHLTMVEPHNSGNYMLLSNTYAALGRRNESRMMRKAMRDTGVIKVPGWSSIEVNGIVEEFSAGERSHPISENIYTVLSQIIVQLKMDKEQWGMLESEDECSCPTF
ncbi:Pentatricopeptide repeat-containing protein [Actinidia chinensis var. chinensis]|uniref:Pentatricopeptide repeat-containing protein n=1 Tax=Actinidia chinensis var. chinensis TaxID=1590841 RepID=A0A2R6P8F1_ACTCC|nr:Pentatricopeptide repeat-containing protein [Actinidia chinensis var. chinensis]